VRVTFVGAGQIGGPMSQRLLAAGHDVTVYARRAEVREVTDGLGVDLGIIGQAVDRGPATFTAR
jgi:3-hydroxyisobutyrate dehydrogenase-like beta-hydroxyacid dehydrogenase